MTDRLQLVEKKRSLYLLSDAGSTALACVLAWLFFSIPFFFTKSGQPELALASALHLGIIQVPAEAKALPSESTVDSERVLARLAAAEAQEENPSLKQDVRQAWITISLAEHDEPIPFIQSSYICYGLHPDKVFAHITALRQAKLGREYSDWYDENGNLTVPSPKKPCQSVRPEIPKERAA